VSTAIKSINPKIKIYGVETERMPKMTESLKNGKITHIEFRSSIADGIGVKKIGENTFDIIRNLVDDIITVTEGKVILL
jgi:threonine dehydratase